MVIHKEISEDNELYLYFNGKLIFKRWINQNYSVVFDVMPYGKNTLVSIKDSTGENSSPEIPVTKKLT